MISLILKNQKIEPFYLFFVLFWDNIIKCFFIYDISVFFMLYKSKYKLRLLIGAFIFSPILINSAVAIEYVDLSKYKFQSVNFSLKREVYLAPDIAYLPISTTHPSLGYLTVEERGKDKDKVSIYLSQNKNLSYIVGLYNQRVLAFGKQDDVKTISDAVNAEVSLKVSDLVLDRKTVNPELERYLKVKLNPTKFQAVLNWLNKPLDEGTNIQSVANILANS